MILENLSTGKILYFVQRKNNYYLEFKDGRHLCLFYSNYGGVHLDLSIPLPMKESDKILGCIYTSREIVINTKMCNSASYMNLLPGYYLVGTDNNKLIRLVYLDKKSLFWKLDKHLRPRIIVDLTELPNYIYPNRLFIDLVDDISDRK